MSDSLEIWTKSTGCIIERGDAHKICKLNNLHSYNKLNKFFE